MSGEVISLSVVREFLASAGMRATLAAFDAEQKRPLPSKRDVCVSLRIGTLIKQNAKRRRAYFNKNHFKSPPESPTVAHKTAAPLPSVLEVVVDFLVHRPKAPPKRASTAGASSSPGVVATTATPAVPPLKTAEKPPKTPTSARAAVRPKSAAKSPSSSSSAVALQQLLSPRSSASAIAPAQAEALNRLVFGRPRAIFGADWHQGFYFREEPDDDDDDYDEDEADDMRFGLVQRKGGPCGVLAPVQAQVLVGLLASCGKDDGDAKRKETVLRPSNAVRRNVLCDALATILWRIGDSRHACVVLSPEIPKAYGPYHLIDMVVHEHFSWDSLRSFLHRHLSAFTEPRGNGVILFVYSALFTRGLDNVPADFDFPEATTLQDKHGYCSQELVNLLLIGRAHSNVFNGTVELGPTTPRSTPRSPRSPRKGKLLRGVGARPEIGYLALFEHYGSCEVGTHFKTPLSPVWVVHSESHYSVLFALSSSALDSPVAELYYYDQLGNSDELYHLSVDASGATTPVQHHDESPLEHVVRTRWRAAAVDWNGSDRLL